MIEIVGMVNYHLFTKIINPENFLLTSDIMWEKLQGIETPKEIWEVITNKIQKTSGNS